LIGGHAIFAGKHVECLVLVSATINTSAICVEAGLPVHWVVGNASLIGSSASCARGQGNSELIPGAATSTSCVGVKARLPVGGIISNALTV